MKATIQDVAQEAGVSASTVSRVLTKKDNVNQDTRERIWAAVEKTGYRYQKANTNAANSYNNMIMVITSDTDSHFFDCWYRAMVPIMEEAGYMVVIGHCLRGEYMDERYLRYAQNQPLAGAFLVTPNETPELRKLLTDKKMATVMINRPLRSLDLDVVCQDHYRSGYQGVAHLIENGHSRILCILGNPASSGDIEKLQGAQAAMEDGGLCAQDLRVEYAGFDTEKAYVLSIEKQKEFLEYTGIYCGSEKMGRGFIEAQHELGRRIAQDVSIICASAVPFSINGCNIVTVRQNATDIGKRAAELMLNALHNQKGKRRNFEKVFLPPVLFPGGSVRNLKEDSSV